MESQVLVIFKDIPYWEMKTHTLDHCVSTSNPKLQQMFYLSHHVLVWMSSVLCSLCLRDRSCTISKESLKCKHNPNNFTMKILHSFIGIKLMPHLRYQAEKYLKTLYISIFNSEEKNVTESQIKKPTVTLRQISPWFTSRHLVFYLKENK